MASLPSNFERQFLNTPPQRISEGQWVRKPFEGMLRLIGSKTRNF